MAEVIVKVVAVVSKPTGGNVEAVKAFEAIKVVVVTIAVAAIVTEQVIVIALALIYLTSLCPSEVFPFALVTYNLIIPFFSLVLLNFSAAVCTFSIQVILFLYLLCLHIFILIFLPPTPPLSLPPLPSASAP